MTAVLTKNLAIRQELLPSRPVSDIEYRRAVEEFDRLWQTGTTEDEQRRMAELLRRIEAFENMTSARGE